WMPAIDRATMRLRVPTLWGGLGLLAAVCVLLALLFKRTAGAPSSRPPGWELSQQEQRLRAGIAGSPADPRPRVSLARFLLSNGRSYDALAASREACGRFPESAAVRSTLADSPFAV